jgi:EAL domain-containing protein (putative c-di-GMP-specific phosphodiesterase class I)
VDPAELLRAADLALYTAKGAGKGHYRFFDPSMHSAALDRLELIGELQRSELFDQLVVHYQPSYDLGSGLVEGLEALLRWHHPGRGLVAPLEFVPLAEETGAIIAIGRWVLREACAQAARLNAQYPREPSLTMSVNVSARQLRDSRFPHDVAAALQAASLSPGVLVLEISETVLMNRDLTVFAALESLRRLGVRIAVDDFGTGYSSLGYLRRLPVDRLKIDRSFVRGVDGDRADVALVEGLVGLARGLGIELVAEGIERPAQLEALRRLQCGVGQGFSLARPLRVDELELLLATEVAAPAPRLRLVSGEGR